MVSSQPAQEERPKSNIIIMGGSASTNSQPTKPEVAEATQETEPVAAVKKPRAFVDESDIFDFSGLQKTMPNQDQKLTIMQKGPMKQKSESSNSSKKVTEM
jgi:hypothetical protein